MYFRLECIISSFGYTLKPPLQVRSRSYTVEARKLEHGFRRISARIPYTLPKGHEENDVPTFWLLL